jgi:hypothetical protein
LENRTEFYSTLQYYFMEIFLSSESTIRQINKEFSRFFPLLRLEFYKRKHSVGETSIYEQKFHERTSLKEINNDLRPAVITINPSDTVADLEQKLQRKFNLSVQVYRRMGDIFLETAETDSLSLEKQNSMGHFADRPVFNAHTLFL